MARIEVTLARAAEVLTEAASGHLLYDNEFKAACARAVSVIKSAERMVATVSAKEPVSEER